MNSAQVNVYAANNMVRMTKIKSEINSDLNDNSIIEESYKVAFRVAYKLLGNREASEDVAIEAVSKLIEKEFAKESFAPSYTARVSARLVISQWRKDAVARKYAPLLNQQISSFDNAYDQSNLRLDLRKALTKLSKKQRETIVLRYLADLPEKDVAEFLKCSLGTVKSTTHDALARLKTMVEVKP